MCVGEESFDDSISPKLDAITEEKRNIKNIAE
jgi:hypothetical protein